MTAIKYSDIISFCEYSNDRCKETICPFHVLHVPAEPFFSPRDVPHTRCQVSLDVQLDESIDVSIRVWMQKIHENPGIFHPFPDEFAKIFEGQTSETPMPISSDCGIIDA